MKLIFMEVYYFKDMSIMIHDLFEVLKSEHSHFIFKWHDFSIQIILFFMSVSLKKIKELP